LTYSADNFHEILHVFFPYLLLSWRRSFPVFFV